MDKTLSDLCSRVREVAAEAAEYIRKERRRVTGDHIEEKSLNSLVSYVDKHAEQMLVDRLSDLIPHSTFITEEDTVENQSGTYTWVIDPLDGTTNYLQGIPHCCVSIALQREGEFVLGVICEVDHGEMYYGWKDGGCYLNEEMCRVSTLEDLSQAVIATGFPYHGDDVTDRYIQVLKAFINRGRGVRRLGSAALDLAYVACGRLDGYYEYRLNRWDIAAGAVLVSEAGGQVGGFTEGQEWKNGDQIVAASPALFPQIQRIIEENYY